MGEIGLLLAVVGVVGMTRGVVLLLLLLLQLGEGEAGSTSSSDVAADREFEAVNLELRAPAVLCRGRRVPKATTGEGKQASTTTTTTRRRRGRRLGEIRVGAWRREEAAMVLGRDKQRRGKAPMVVGKLMRELGVSLGWVWVCICSAVLRFCDERGTHESPEFAVFFESQPKHPHTHALQHTTHTDAQVLPAAAAAATAAGWSASSAALSPRRARYVFPSPPSPPPFLLPHPSLTHTLPYTRLRHLQYVTFKAGRCDVEDKCNNKFLITPDRRKGQLTLLKHVDELTHLQWKDRTTNTVIEDVIVMPHDAYFARVNTGRTKDRVYILQYQGGSSRRFFFWMQSASDEKDEELVTRLNECMTEPPPDDAVEGGAGGASGVGAGGAPASQQNVEDLLSSMLGGGTTGGQSSVPAPSAAVTAPASGSSSAGAAGRGGQLTAADLQRAMMNLTGMQQQQQQRSVPLTEVINADEVLRSGLLADPAVQEQLIPLLAEGQQTPEQLEAIMHSPQLRSSLGSLTGALQTDNFNSIMSNFGLDPSRGMEALAAGNNVEAFLQALLALQQSEEGGAGGGAGEEKMEEKEEGKEEERQRGFGLVRRDGKREEGSERMGRLGGGSREGM